MKLDSAAKRRITRQWQQALPTLEVWRPMRLLRRIGPVLQGVTLDVANSGTEYFPTAHVHPLTLDFPVVSLMLSHRLAGVNGVQERIPADADETTVQQAAERLREQSPLSLDSPPTLAQIVAAFRKFIDAQPTVKYGPSPEMEQSILLAGFTSAGELFSEQVEYVNQVAASWSVSPPKFGTTEAWLADLVAKSRDVGALQAFAEAQATKLKVNTLRQVDLIA